MLFVVVDYGYCDTNSGSFVLIFVKKWKLNKVFSVINKDLPYTVTLGSFMLKSILNMN